MNQNDNFFHINQEEFLINVDVVELINDMKHKGYHSIGEAFDAMFHTFYIVKNGEIVPFL